MRVRRVAIVLMAVGIVTSAIYATGAFSGILVSRDASVSVTGDASGYLGLKPAPGPNGAYARYGDGGQLRLTLSEAVSTENASGEGLNPGAVTTVENVFTITNQGTQSVGLWLMDGSDAVTFTVDGQSIEGQGNAIALGTGDTKPVSVEIDTRNADVNQNLLESVTFEADTDVNGQDVSEQDGGDSGGSESEESESNDDQTEQPQPTPTPTPKAKEEGGFNPLNPDDYAEAGDDLLKAGDELLKVTDDFLTGLADMGRQELLEKLSYVTNQPLDALKSLGETAWNTLMGFFLGEIGMPDGFTARESHSAFYLGGSMLSVFNPITDTVAGIRDFAAYVVKGDMIGAAIEAAGLLPPGKVAESLSDLKSVVNTWTKYNPSEAKKMFQPIHDTFLVHLPTGPREKLIDLFPGGAKQLDDSGSATSKSEDAVAEINYLSKQKGELGYTNDRMKRMINNEEYTTSEIEILAKKNIDLTRVERVNDQGFSNDQILYFVKNNDETLLTPSLKQVEELRNAGYKPDDLVYIFKNGKSKYAVPGVTPSKLKKLSDQGFSSSDVKHYTQHSVSLGFVSMLGKKASPSKVKGFVRTVRMGGTFTEYYGLYRNAKSWCDMKKKNGKKIGICQKMPSVP